MAAPVVGLADLNRIADRYGVPSLTTLPTPWIGATSRVYPVRDVVLKVSFDRPDAIQALKVESAVSPLMRRHGIATPELLGYDESREFLPVPFAIYRRARDSTTLEALATRQVIDAAWTEVGRQLAIVHAIRQQEGLPPGLRTFRQTPEVDPRPWVDALRERGALGAADAAWLSARLDEIAPLVAGSDAVTLCHGDVNAANILVHQDTASFLAIIDWSGAGWLDPAWDFAGVPLAVVPFLLSGHRLVAPLPDDRSVEARVFWCQTQTRLHAALADADRGIQSARLDRSIQGLQRFANTVPGLG